MDYIINPKYPELYPASGFEDGMTIKGGKHSDYGIMNKVYHWSGKNIYLGGKDLDKESAIDYLYQKMKEIEKNGIEVPEQKKLKQGFFTDSDDEVKEAYNFVIGYIHELSKSKAKRKPEIHEIKPEVLAKEEKLFGISDDELLKSSGNQKSQMDDWASSSYNDAEVPAKLIEKSKVEPKKEDVDQLFEEDTLSKGIEPQKVDFDEWLNTAENIETKATAKEKIENFIETFNHISQKFEVIKSDDSFTVRLIFADNKKRLSFVKENRELLSIDKNYTIGSKHDLTLTPEQTFRLVFPQPHDFPALVKEDYRSIMELIFKMQEKNKNLGL